MQNRIWKQCRLSLWLVSARHRLQRLRDRVPEHRPDPLKA